MATFYLDYVNGNDANDGTTWALAWKTLTLGATAARIAPGDTIRIAKSPDPTSLGQTATWTNLSRAVTLTDAVTKNVYLDGAWTAATDVTATTSTTRKEGANSSSIAIATAFTTGLAAYYPLGSAQDFSAYQQLSFWIRTSVALATADTLRVCLCSDTAGVTIVDSFSVPSLPAINAWQVVTVDKGSALGSSIQSVALYCQTDPGTPTVLIDNIIACKSVGSADSLSLSSLISKNTGSEGWFGIKSINGTAIQLDSETSSGSGSGRGYSGTTETVTTHKRETIKVVPVAASAVAQEIMDSGTIGSLILFEGGYNTGTSTVDGQTIFDGQNGAGFGVQISSKSFTDVRLNCVRYDRGVYYSTSANNTATITNANNCTQGVYYFTSNNNTATITNANNCTQAVYYNGSNNNIATITNANNCTYGVYYNANNNIATITNANNCNNGVFYTNANNNIATIENSPNNSSSSVYTDSGSVNYLRNSTLNSATKITGFTNFSNGFVWSNNENNNTDTHFGYTDGGLIASETSVRKTALGISWRLSPTSNNRSSGYPLPLKIGAVACTANNAITFKAWFRRSNTGLTMRLRVKGGQLSGVADTSISMTAAIDTWEELSLTVTPTQKGVLEFHAEAWGGTKFNGYVDDVTIS